MSNRLGSGPILVVGGGHGIGAETARALGRSDVSVVVADVDRDAAREVVRTIELASGDASGVVLDVTDDADVSRLSEFLSGRRPLAGLVVAAGVYPADGFRAMTHDRWRSVMDVNVDGAVRVLQAALPSLRPGASVVTVASVAAHRGSAGHAHYAASKAALVSLTKSLAVELGPDLRINTVSPGPVDTAMLGALDDAARAALVAQTPLGRLGRPEDVAHAITFLLSDAASFITGQVLHVNGGFHVAG